MLATPRPDPQADPQAAKVDPGAGRGKKRASSAGFRPSPAPRGEFTPEAKTLSDRLARQTDALLAARIRAADVSSVAIERAPDLASKGRQAARGALVLRVGGRLVCSAVDPLGEAQRWAAAQDVRPDDVVVVFGLGAGHHLEALRERGCGAMLVVEPSAVLIKARLSAEDALIDGLDVVDTPGQARAWLSRRLSGLRRGQLLVWPPTRRLHREALALTQRALHSSVALATITASTLRKRFAVWVEHVLVNLPLTIGKTPASRLEGWLAGRPAFIVSAGPSLADNVEALARVGSRGVIIAVNTSLAALDRAGVRADLVVILEAQDMSEQLDGLVHNADVPRALAVSAHPELFRRANGPVLPFVEAVEAYQTIGREVGLAPAVPSGGSVANSAFALARLLGARTIVLVGQDLSYRADGQVYAAGTLFEEMRVVVADDGAARYSGLEAKHRIAASRPEVAEVAETGQLGWAPGWGGAGRVATTSAFCYFRDVFEQWARAAGPELRLINATEGGAHIAGFEERRLAEVVDGLAPADPGAWPSAPVSRDDVQAALSKELVRVEAARQAAQAIAGGAAEQLPELRSRVEETGLLHGFCWASLCDLIGRGGDMEDLGRCVAADAETLSTLLEKAVSMARG